MDEFNRIPYQAQSLPVAEARGVLLVAPHPDDEVFGCGGSAIHYCQAGIPVRALILTRGGRSGVARQGEGIEATRMDESRRAAAVLGCVPPLFGEWPDRAVRNGPELVQQLVGHMRLSNANVLFAPSLWEMHPDHRAAGLAAADAIQHLGNDCRLVQYEVGATLLPNVLVDITRVWSQKKLAMSCFQSQLALKDYGRHVNALNVFRSYTLPGKVAAAEALRVASAAEVLHDPYGLVFRGHRHPSVAQAGAAPQ